MNLQHDAQGFLSGDRVGQRQAGAPASALIGAIHRDVAIIRRLLTSGVGRVGGGRRSSRSAIDDAVEAAVRSVVASPSVVRQAARSAMVRQAVEAGARAAVSPRARDSRGRFIGSASASAPTGGPSTATARQSAVAAMVDAQRDARGRFAGGASDRAGGDGVIGRLAGAVDGLSDMVNGADNIDPTIAALKEVRDAVSPVGRGFMALHARLAERKKERWYARILKAITGRRGEVAAGGGAGDVQRGSFFGTMLGELGGKLLGGLGGMAGGALGFIGTVLSRVFAPVAAVWAAWEVGQWIGTKIRDWLDRSGIAGKIGDAFDSVATWFKGKARAVGDAARDVVSQANRAAADAQAGSNDARYRPMSPEDRREARQSVRGGAPDSMAYKAGQVAGTIMRGVDAVGGAVKVLQSGAGFNVVQKSDGSVVKQQGARNWRNNNPGNIEFGPFAKKMGAIGSDGRFAIFPDYETGRRAKASLIFEGSNYRDLNLSDAISRYAPPTENNTGAYQRAVLQAVGGKNRRMSDYSPAERSAILDAMQRVEGFKVGTVTPMTGPAIKPAPAMATLQAIKPQSVPPSAPERVQVVQPDKTPERVSWGREDRAVVVQKEEVGQDLRDRRAAHIVTGGLGG